MSMFKRLAGAIAIHNVGYDDAKSPFVDGENIDATAVDIDLYEAACRVTETTMPGLVRDFPAYTEKQWETVVIAASIVCDANDAHEYAVSVPAFVDPAITKSRLDAALAELRAALSTHE